MHREEFIRSIALGVAVVLTINMCMYQDGSVSPVTLEQMKKLKNAIRG